MGRLKNQYSGWTGYDTAIKYYSNRIEIKKYNRSIFRKTDDSKSVENKSQVMKKIVKSEKKVSSEELKEIRRDSLNRTRRMLIDYASMNENKFNSFITLTFADNVTDIGVANKCFQNWVRSVQRAVQRKNMEFYYLAVPEYQKRGAVHYHMFTSLECGSDLLPLQDDKKSMYDVKYWNHGFSSAFDIMHDTDANFNISLYITKYLYKDIDNRLFGRKKILKSNNLEKPVMQYLNENSDTYKNAMEYIEENYSYTGNKRVKENKENKYSIGFEILNYTENEYLEYLIDSEYDRLMAREKRHICQKITQSDF